MNYYVPVIHQDPVCILISFDLLWLYLADYIEPGRDKAPNLARVRRLAFEDLDECMYEVLRDTLDYLGSNPKTLDPATKEAFVYYEEIHNNKTKKEVNI